MAWIAEMFANMEKDRAAASARRSAKAPKAQRTEHLKRQIPGALDAWNALVASIAKDLSEFNKHKERAGQAPVHMSQRHFQCEVYVPGMQSKRLVLTLDNNDLRVSVHPDFPRQQLTITIEPETDGQHGFWFLGEPAKESGKRSADQLSEYLLKPILACADTNTDPAPSP
jgi:HSP20 family molecular chaperone IbpA